MNMNTRNNKILKEIIKKIAEVNMSDNIFVFQGNEGHVNLLNKLFLTDDSYIYRFDKNCFLMCRGKIDEILKIMVKIVDNYVEQSVYKDSNLNRIKNNLVEISELSKLININEHKKEAIVLSEVFQKLYKENLDKNASKLSDEERNILEKEAQSIIEQIKQLLMEINTVKRTSFLDDKNFWIGFSNKLEYLIQFYSSEEYKFIRSALETQSFFLTSYVLKNLRNLDKYYELKSAFLKFYLDLDLENLYFPIDFKDFVKSLKGFTANLCSRLSSSPKTVKRSILKRLPMFLSFIHTKIAESDIIMYCDEIFSVYKNVYSNLTALLDDSINHFNDSVSEESSLTVDFSVVSELKNEILSFERINEAIIVLKNSNIIYCRFSKHIPDHEKELAFEITELKNSIDKSIELFKTKSFESIVFKSPEKLIYCISSLFNALAQQKDVKIEDSIFYGDGVDFFMTLDTLTQDEYTSYVYKSYLKSQFIYFFRFSNFSICLNEFTNYMLEKIDQFVENTSIKLLSYENSDLSSLSKYIYIFMYLSKELSSLNMNPTNNTFLLEKVGYKMNLFKKELVAQILKRTKNMLLFIEKANVNEEMLIVIGLDNIEIKNLDIYTGYCKELESFYNFLERIYTENELNAENVGVLELIRCNDEYARAKNYLNHFHKFEEKYENFKTAIYKINCIFNSTANIFAEIREHLEEIFAVLQRIVNLKLKYIMKLDSDIRLLSLIKIIEEKLLVYDFSIGKIRNYNLFLDEQDQLSINILEFDNARLAKRISRNDEKIIISAIHAMHGCLIVHYLESILFKLENKDSRLFSFEYCLENSNKEKLFEFFKIVDLMVQNVNRLLVICTKEERSVLFLLIDKIYNNIVKIFDFMYTCLKKATSALIFNDPIDFYFKVREKIDSLEKINHNKIPFFKFDGYIERDDLDVKLVDTLALLYSELDLNSKNILDHITIFCEHNFDNSILNINNLEDFNSKLCNDTTTSSILIFCGKIVHILELYEKNFSELKKISVILKEENYHKVSNHFFSLNEKYITLKKIIIIVKGKLEKIEKNEIYSFIDSYKINSILPIKNKLDEISINEDIVRIIDMYGDLKKDLYVEEMNFYYIKKSCEHFMINYENLDSLNSIFSVSKELERMFEAHRAWNCVINKKICDISSEEIKSLVTELSTISPSLTLYKSFISEVRNQSYICKYVEELNKFYIEKEFFDNNEILKDILSKHDELSINEAISKSKNSYQTKSNIQKIRNEIEQIKYKIDTTIKNYEEVENVLEKVLIDIDFCINLNKHIPLNTIAYKLKEYIGEMFLGHECLIKIETNLAELVNIVMGSHFKDVESKYHNAFGDYKTLLEKLTFVFKDKKYISVKDIVIHLDNLKNIEEKIKDAFTEVKNRLENFRKRFPKFYFIGDIDLIYVMNKKKDYVYLIKKIYNIDNLVVKDGFVEGFTAENDVVMIDEHIEINDDLEEFFVSFDNVYHRTLKRYFLHKIRNVLITNQNDNNESRKLQLFLENNTSMESKQASTIKNRHISFIDDCVNEYCYFSGFDHNKTSKIKLIQREENKWGDDFKKLYPIPRIEDGMFKIGDTSHNNLAFTYYSPTDMIFTRLTSAIFSTIMLSLKIYSGIILFGNSGTGKTETVKYFCRSVCVPVYVFCCNEECEYQTIKNVITGCVYLGYYLCFDEFNRLNKKVMSSITECIFENKDKLKIFLTMNIGYTGRHSLPKSLNSLFGEIRVDNPEIQEIVNVYFDSFGDRILNFLYHLRDNCSKEEHYNFSLRAVKTIIKSTKLYDEITEANDVFDVIYRKIYMFFAAFLSTKDRHVLNSSFLESFNHEFKDKLTYEDLFEYGLENKNGVLLFGKAVSGKSYLIRNVATKRNATLYIYNPLNDKYFFGKYDENTGEWCDSSFIKKLRNSGKEETWFVFDSVLDSVWIENFNSALDDNKIFCLKSGEIIKLDKNIKFIFEADSISMLTPATLTRVFTLFIENNNFEVLDDMKSLCNKGINQKNYSLCSKVAYNGVDYYQNMIMKILEHDNVVKLSSTAGSGKFSIASSMFKTKLVRFSAEDLKGKFFEDIIGPENIKMRRGNKWFDENTVLFIEEFEKAEPQTIEMIREYFKYKKIGDIFIDNLKIICSYDIKKEHERIQSKIKEVYINEFYADEAFLHDYIAKIMDKKNVKLSVKDIAITIKFVQYIHNTFRLGVKEITEFIYLLICGLEIENQMKHLLYFISQIFIDFSRISNTEVLNLLNNPEGFLEFDFRDKFFVVKNPKHDNLSTLKFLIYSGTSIIIEGHKLSGKRFLIESLNIPFKINLVGFYEIKKYKEQSIYLVENRKYISKEILRKCVIFTMQSKKDYYIDLTKLYEKNYSEDFSIIIDDCSIDNPECYSNLYYSEKAKNQVLKFDNYFKVIDFIQTLRSVNEEINQEHSLLKKHVENGLKRIEEFKTLSSKLVKDSEVKMVELNQISNGLRCKINEIADKQSCLDLEKRNIKIKKSELENIAHEMKSKKNLVDSQLSEVIPLISSAKDKISTLSKKHLAEIKMMIKPPEIIKLTIQAVYIMLEDNISSEKITWQRLLQYIKQDDFIPKVLNFVSIKNFELLDSLLCSEKNVVERAHKASKACAVLLDWVVANYRYHKVLKDVKPLRDEIVLIEQRMKGNNFLIEKETERLLKLENLITAKRKEYAELNERLEQIKFEVKKIDQENSQITTILEKIQSEIPKWKVKGKPSTLDYIFTSRKWLFSYKKSIFVPNNQQLSINKSEYVSFSMKDKGFKHALLGVYKFHTNIIVYDCDYFCPEVYKLLKYQAKAQNFHIILVSNYDVNNFRDLTYEFKEIKRFELTDKIDIQFYERALLDKIASNSTISEILEAIQNLEVKRSEYLLQAEQERYMKRLNDLYEFNYNAYFDKFGFGLSYQVFSTYIEKVTNMYKNNLPSLEKVTNKFFDLNNSEDIISLVEEIGNFSFDYSFISDSDEVIYILEKLIHLGGSYSAGSSENNKSILCLLNSLNESPALFMIKNTHLLERVIKKGNNRFIFTSEYSYYNPVISGSKIILYNSPTEYEDIKMNLTRIHGEEYNDIINFHGKVIHNIFANKLDKKYSITYRNFIMLLKGSKIVSIPYLKKLIYYNRIDTEDMSLVFDGLLPQ